MKTVPLHKTREHSDGLPDWRDLARALVPEVYAEVSEWEEPTAYRFLSALCHFARGAHRESDESKLSRAYAFANWAFDHPSEALWNPAGVCFFEHIFQDTQDYDRIVPWIRPDIFPETVALIEYIYDADIANPIKAAKAKSMVTKSDKVAKTLTEALQKIRTGEGPCDAG